MISITGLVSAQYLPFSEGASVLFTIKNFGFDVTGKFSGIHGKIDFDPLNTSNARFDIIVDAGSINTDNGLRDQHLKGEDYFDVAEHPDIHFLSTGISPGASKGMFLLTGKLTIKNIVREIQFPFVAIPSDGGYIFKGSFKMRRKDFKVGGTSTLSDELEVRLNVQAKRS